eukprot:scaffold895_cov315-Pinguiococcus_pyrenoidosus.AAC.43
MRVTYTTSAPSTASASVSTCFCFTPRPPICDHEHSEAMSTQRGPHKHIDDSPGSGHRPESPAWAAQHISAAARQTETCDNGVRVARKEKRGKRASGPDAVVRRPGLTTYLASRTANE